MVISDQEASVTALEAILRSGRRSQQKQGGGGGAHDSSVATSASMMGGMGQGSRIPEVGSSLQQPAALRGPGDSSMVDAGAGAGAGGATGDGRGLVGGGGGAFRDYSDQ